MKLNRSSKSAAIQGSVLLVALGTVIVLGIILAAVLALITQERRVLARTASWNTALPTAEAGIEEAMSHLQQVQDGPRSGVNGWEPGENGSATKVFVLSPDSRYLVAISSAPQPTIISEGQTYCTNAGKFIKRTVQVTTTNVGMFSKALVAKRGIAVGGSFLVDSFDSTDPALSSNGQYDPTKRSDKGSVASNSSEPGAITLSGGVQIYGSLSTGPTGTVVSANNPSVGSESWVDSGKKGIEPDHYTADMNLAFEAATIPFTNTITPKPGVVDGVTYDYVLPDGDYRLSTLNVKGAEYMYVSGKARLIVDKDITGSAAGRIHIATNASLEVYVKQGTVKLTGASILNDSGKATNFTLFGLNGLSNIDISGGFLGSIYAPNATLKLSGGGEFFGAVVVAEIKANGNYQFHYDEALAKKYPIYLRITSWQEI